MDLSYDSGKPAVWNNRRIHNQPNGKDTIPRDKTDVGRHDARTMYSEHVASMPR